jgi:DNA-binding NtrC family response regulator
VVEDEAVLGQGVARILDRGGYRVLSAPDPATALDLDAEHGCDLLLTDVVLPDMSGPRLADLLHRRHPDLPVLYMSGYPDRHLDAARLLDKTTRFLEKPFTAQRLLTQVHQALTHAQPADAQPVSNSAPPAADQANPTTSG